MAILLSALAGLILGAPTLRLRSDYLAIVTLGFGEIIRIAANNTAYVGEPRGISNIPHPPSLSAQQVLLIGPGVVLVILILVALATVPSLIDRSYESATRSPTGRTRLMILGVGILLALGVIVLAIVSPRPPRTWSRACGSGSSTHFPYYYLVILLAVLVIVVKRLENSRVGQAWVAIREDEDAAELMGVPTFRFKLWSFAIGASIGGAVDVVFSSKVIAIVPDNFPFILSVLILTAVVLGGSGNLPGVILGAFPGGVAARALPVGSRTTGCSCSGRRSWPLMIFGLRDSCRHGGAGPSWPRARAAWARSAPGPRRRDARSRGRRRRWRPV